jgi:hypothetical protein
MGLILPIFVFCKPGLNITTLAMALLSATYRSFRWNDIIKLSLPNPSILEKQEKNKKSFYAGYKHRRA